MAEQYPSLSDAKIPFASYDTVVYFGGGTFFLAVLGFYFKTAMPPFPNPSSFNEYVSSAITAIGILFFVYLIGHGIAFLSALFVEGLCTSTYGFPSAIYLGMTTDGLENRKKIRQDFYKNFLKSFDAGAWITGIPRYMFTAPILLFSAGMAMALAVGSALPKLPSGLPDLIQFKLDKYDLADAYQKSGHGRFKIVEHFVNCNYPESARRMYNYLMIYGLLRTGTFILLISFWLEANQILIEKYKFVLINLPSYAHIRDRPGSYGMILTLTALLSTAYFCYIKFNRRYFEEAMLAFALRKE